MSTIISESPAQTAEAGACFARGLRGGELVLFTGGLGCGKTTFCRGIAEALGSTDPVSSPTFAVANYYRGRVPFAHFDAYRVTGPEDLETAGFYDYLEAGAVVAVEWSENIAPFVDPPYIRIDMKNLGEARREITIHEVSVVD